MSAWSLLLRVVLILAIALNGAVPAMASAHVGMDVSAGAGSPPPREGISGEAGGKAAISCHTAAAGGHAEHNARLRDSAYADSALPIDHSNHHATQPEGSGTGHDGGCCESGTCRCSCMHTCQALVLGVTLLPAVVEHAPSVGRMPHKHATPMLPHLIRPPIG